MAKHRREQGQGSVFRHKGCKRWVVQYYVDGRPVREATGLTSRVEAQKVLTARLNAVSKGEPITVRAVRVSELYTHLEKHNAANGKPVATNSMDAARWRLHLCGVFGNALAARITGSMLLDYRTQRQDAGAAVATINRELALLRHMLRLAHQDGLIAAAPPVKLAPENNIREGFVPDAKLDELRNAAASQLWLRTMVELGAVYGWRRGEMLGLRVRQVDFAAGVIRLGVGTTKNRKGREVPMNTVVRLLLASCCHGKQPDAHVLTRKDGTPARDVRCAWRNLCCAVGLGVWRCRCGHQQAAMGRCPQCKARAWQYRGLLVHDLRRTAARNLRRAGVAENVAMTITGHETPSQYRRYNIVNNADKVVALHLLEQAAATAVSGKVVVKEGAAQPPQSPNVQ